MEVCQQVYSYSRDHDFVSKSLDIIEECLDQVKSNMNRICLGFNGGKDCTVLLVLVRAVLQNRNLCQSLKSINVSNARDSFTEMEDFVDQCTRDFHLQMIRLPGGIKDALFDLKQKDEEIEAIFMGTRATDVPKDKEVAYFQKTDEGWPEFLRVCPILDWTYHEVWQFLRDLKIPYCSLYDMGYTSIGSVSDTHRNPRLMTPSSSYLPAWQLQDSDDERQGRIQSQSC